MQTQNYCEQQTKLVNRLAAQRGSESDHRTIILPVKTRPEA